MTTRTRILVAAVAGCLTVPSPGRTAGPEPGTWLEPGNAASAQDLLPKEFLGRYERGEWKHEVLAPSPGVIMVDPQWAAASKENEGKYKVNEEGSIRRLDNDEEPTSIYGAPFPTVTANDPQAAVKLIWNFFYNYWGSLGNNLNSVSLTWVSPSGVDREATNTVYQRFWDGQKPHRLPQENPMNVLFQQFVSTDSPADLQGINALVWRYRDTRRDSTWSYVPALRRVRQVTPANRADGFLGSDMAQDDGGYFDAKPEDFAWKLLGEGEQLFQFDRVAVTENSEHLEPLPDGGWRSVYTPGPRFDYQKPDFDSDKELAWAPVSDRYVLVKRPVWILEGTPKDRYYLYGKIVLRIDKENYTGSGSYSSKYDWQGNLLNSYMPGARGTFHEKGDDYRSYSGGPFTMAQNWKLNRATVSSPLDGGPSDSLIQFDEQRFDTDMLARGK
jgi:hypothetical protein